VLLAGAGGSRQTGRAGTAGCSEQLSGEQTPVALKSALTCSSALHLFCALVQLVLEGTRRVLKDRTLSVFSDDDSGSFSAQELKLRMNNATSHRTKTKKTKLQT